jgi:hypothetical protein
MLSIGPQLEQERTQDFEQDGVKFKLRYEDPYGFLKVYCLNDKRYLNEQFTNLTAAKIGIAKYLKVRSEKKDK